MPALLPGIMDSVRPTMGVEGTMERAVGAMGGQPVGVCVCLVTDRGKARNAVEETDRSAQRRCDQGVLD
jgi:hypothetical protein